MNALAHNYLFWTAVIFGLLALYILPSVIAVVRGVPGLGWIILLNLLPTGVGWLAALIAAVALPHKHPVTQPPPQHPTGPPTCRSHWPGN